MSVSNVLGVHATEAFSRHSFVRAQSGTGSGGSKRRLGALNLSNPASSSSMSRKQAERQNSIKSRYSNKSNKSARHDDEQLYAREEGEVEVEELGSRVTEQAGAGDITRPAKKPRPEWITPHDETDMVSPPSSPSPSKRRISAAILRSGSSFSAHYRLASWLSVLTMHTICTTLYGLLAAIHAKLPRTELSTVLPRYSPDLVGFSTFSAMTYVFSSILAVIHGAATFRMLYRSLRDRQLMYYAPNYFSAARIDQIMPFSASMRALTGAAPANPRAPRPTTRNVLRSLVLKCWWMFQEMLWARRDLVELNYTASSERTYRMTLIGQTVVHCCEAVVMSSLVGVSWLHYVYMTLLIANAWVPLVFTLLRNGQVILWHSHRISSLLVSIVLDVFGVLVVPAVLIQSYSSDYDMSTQNFSRIRWFCDRWLVRMLLEIQFLLAVNTISSVVRLVMGLHLLCSLNALKSLLESVTSNRPPIPSTERSVSGSPTKMSLRTKRLIKIKRGARRTVVMEVVLVLVGVIMLTSHLNAQSKSPDPTSCPLPLRPLFSIRPACPLLELNCAANPDLSGGVDGTDLESQLTEIDRLSVRHFVIRACPRVHISSTMHRLPSLIEFKIRHSTLTSWPAEAEVTDSSHPVMRRFTAVNVTMAELPAGLLSHQFPHTLVEVDLCGTNISSLPADLHERWPRVEALALELSDIDLVPATLLQMGMLRGLSLRGNNISMVPTELLAKPGLVELSLGRNPIELLPTDVHATSLKLLAVDSTKLRAVPVWATTKADLRVLMGTTPFCENLDPATTDIEELGVDCATQRDDAVFPLLLAE